MLKKSGLGRMVITVEPAAYKKIHEFGRAMHELLLYLVRNGLSLDNFAFEVVETDGDMFQHAGLGDAITRDTQELVRADAYKLFLQAKDAFEKETGLILWLGYHDKFNRGDRFDDVDGGYLYVEGAYTWTNKGGEAFNNGYIDKSFYLEF